MTALSKYSGQVCIFWCDLDLIFITVNSARAVIGIYRHTKFINDILKTMDTRMLTTAKTKTNQLHTPSERDTSRFIDFFSFFFFTVFILYYDFPFLPMESH